MAVNVNTNLVAMHAQHRLSRISDRHATSMERLSSGLKVNTAKDDAAGLQISNRLQSQSQGMDMAIRNANDGVSMLQTAEGALAEYSTNLMRMRDLTLRYVNGSLNAEDQNAILLEFEDLKEELNRIVQTTSFAGDKLLNGSQSLRSFQVGSSSGEAVLVEFPDIESKLEQTGNNTQKVFYAPISNYKVDNWRADPGQRIGVKVVYSEDNSTELLISDAMEGATMEDIVENLNDKYGDKINFYLDGSIDSSTLEERDVGKADQLRLCYTSDKDAYITIQLRYTSESTRANNPFYYGTGRSYIDNHPAELELPKLENGSDDVVAALDDLIHFVDSARAYLGSSQNRLFHAINNLSQSSEKVAASGSQIRNTDFAKQTSELTKQSILNQVNTSILAQANSSNVSAMNLLN
ncbi:TPA: flagellin B [Vibrio parahaemolyticus]|uniref:flagellin N-terminal helical domain-containing protein n=1 Tax=Vibrio TaxID=662 RepID=UPI00111ECAA1|nr:MULTISPECIES: flagellin [Vibrio]EKZ8661753.1 flagellin B [Vibrio alginolyticus]MDW2458010.1 flagellin [Vibrio sp. 1249-1]TOG47370.1 flagellin B [Vibrio parahaemolyticus]HCE1957570.1 flagellin B [Vibrio parahaemolyticus]HCG5140332.1 flagellin B [Vibrio parahaemolyticus]